MMQDFDFYRPRTLNELKEKLTQPGVTILAGGTDIIPKMRKGEVFGSILVDASGINSLRFIEDQGDEVAIGSLTTHQEIADSPLLNKINPALSAAARSIGCIQTRCRGTLGGNIANASPAGDTIPPLMVFDASVLIHSHKGERKLILEDFFKGPGKVDLRQGEFIHSISFAPLSGAWGAAFLKIGKRTGMAISVANAAAAICLDNSGSVEEVRIALGAVGPVVIRSREAERVLQGKKLDASLIEKAAEISRKEIQPITDIRSTDDYRFHSAGVIVKRVLDKALEEALRRME